MIANPKQSFKSIRQRLSSIIKICHTSAFQLSSTRSVNLKIINYGKIISANLNNTTQKRALKIALIFQQKYNLIKFRSFDPLPQTATKGSNKPPPPHTEVKSGDLSIMHDSNDMPRRKLPSEWLNTHVTEQGFRQILQQRSRERIKGPNFNQIDGNKIYKRDQFMYWKDLQQTILKYLQLLTIQKDGSG